MGRNLRRKRKNAYGVGLSSPFGSGIDIQTQRMISELQRNMQGQDVRNDNLDKSKNRDSINKNFETRGW